MLTQCLKDQRNNPTMNEHDGIWSMIFAIRPIFVSSVN